MIVYLSDHVLHGFGELRLCTFDRLHKCRECREVDVDSKCIEQTDCAQLLGVGRVWITNISNSCFCLY